jgi:hypothetical protein
MQILCQSIKAQNASETLGFFSFSGEKDESIFDLANGWL